jgi:hypothetical protein
MPAAKVPRRTGGIAALGMVLALLAIAVGVLAVRDGLAYGGLLGSEPLLHPLAKGIQGLRPSEWVLVAGIVLAVVGLLLLVRALRPSTPKVVPVTAGSGVYLRPRDVGRLVETAVEGVDGVLDVRASATPRRVTLTVGSTGDAGVAERARAAATARLEPLARRPALRLRTQGTNR